MGVYVTDNEIDFFRNQVKIAENLREVSKTKQREIDDLKEQILTFQSQMRSMTEQMMHDDRRFSAIIDEKNEAVEDANTFRKIARGRYKELCELQKRYDKLVQEDTKRVAELQKSRDSLDEECLNLIDENYALKCEINRTREELKSALEALHDQYDESDKPCCKKCVHCRPFIGSTDCYCSQTAEIIKNKDAETFYCKEMIPYEDDYPF